MTKAIITGAPGFVGSHVYHTLASKGVDVLAVIRSNSSYLKNTDQSPNHLNYIVFDWESGLDFKEALQNAGWDPGDDCVFYHFAWEGTGNLTGGDLSVQMKNVHLSTEAIRHAKEAGCTKFINAGTYEETLLEGYFAGVHDGNGVDLSSVAANYVIAKIANRNMCFLKAYLEKIDYIHTRFSVPLSADGKNEKFIEKQIMNIRNNQSVITPGNKNALNFIHIKDLANAYYELGKTGQNQKDYFIRTDLFASIGELFNYLQQYKQDNTANMSAGLPYQFSATDASVRHTDYINDEYAILSHLKKIITN